MDGRVTDISSAEEDANWDKEVVGGTSDILDVDKVKEVVWDKNKDLTDDHTCDVGDEEDYSEKKNTEDVFLQFPGVWR